MYIHNKNATNEDDRTYVRPITGGHYVMEKTYRHGGHYKIDAKPLLLTSTPSMT
jgi:hypothetical protein